MNRLTHIPVLFFIILVLGVSCGVPGPAGAWLSHINEVRTILNNNPDNAEEAAGKVIAYIEKNRKNILEISGKLKQLTPEEGEKVYLQILQAQESLVDYINTHPTKENPLIAHKPFVSAVQLLFQ